MLGVFSSSIVSPPDELVAAGSRTPSPKTKADDLMKKFLENSGSAVSLRVGESAQLAFTHDKESPLQPRSFGVKDEILCLFEGALARKVLIFKSIVVGSSNMCLKLYQTTSRYESASSSPSSESFHPADDLHKLYRKDWLAPNEVVKIFETLEPNSVLPVLKHVSKRKDHQPKETLYSVVVRKLGQARNFGAIDDLLVQIKTERKIQLSDGFFYNVIKVYGNVGGLIDKAVDILFQMPSYGVSPSVRTFNFVLNLLANKKQFDIIHQVFLAASNLGVQIDACCLNIFIKGLCADGRLDDAYKVLDEFPKLGCEPNVRTFSTIMHGLCEHGKLDEAFELLKRMEKEGTDPDTITFNILISGQRKQRKVEDAMELLIRMKAKGCDPNAGSYQELLYGLLDAKRLTEASDLISLMISKGMEPSFESYKLIIMGLCEESTLEEAHWMLKNLIKHGFVPRQCMWSKLLEKVFSGKLDPEQCQFPAE